MPLPEAKPTPDKANIYEQFSNITVADLTRDQLDIVRDPLNLNSQSEDVLRRINLIGAASNQMSASGVIPGAGKFVTVTVTDTNKAVLFQPEEGEVYILQGLGAIVSGGTGTRTFAAYVYDGTNELLWMSVSSSGGNLSFIGEAEYPDAPFYFSKELYCRVASTGTFDSIKYVMAVQRVR